MTWYRTGTVAVTNGSTTVTGTGTAFIANVDIGEGFHGPDGRIYEIANVVSDTVLMLATVYLGSTASGQGYQIVPARGRINDLAAAAADLLNSFATVRDGVGAGKHPDGSAATPAIRFDADQDTGLYRIGANQLGMAVGGQRRLDLSGTHLKTPGIISTGLDTSTGDAILEVGAERTGVGAAYVDLHAVNSTDFEARFIRYGGANGAMELTNTGTGTLALQQINAGDITLKIQGSDKLFIKSSTGHVAIGHADPASRLDVRNGSGGGISGPSGANWAARIVNNQDGDGYAGLSVQTRWASATVPIFECAKGWNGSAAGYYPVFTVEGIGHSRAGEDNAYNLGTASFRWKEGFIANGTINTSDARAKKWRGALTAKERRAGRRIADEFGFYQWLDAVEGKGKKAARWHFGVRAQRVIEIMMEEGIEAKQAIDFPDDIFVPEEDRPKLRTAFLCFDTWEDVFVPETIEIPHTEFEEVPRDTGLLDDDGKPIIAIEKKPVVTYVRVETGEQIHVKKAGNRFGLRPDQLLMFLMAAQEAEIAAGSAALQTLENQMSALETRLAALEAA